MPRGHGFTLIDVMVTVAIVGLLATIALPSYQNSINRSNRAQAKGLLLQDAQFLERNYSLPNRYDQDSAGAAVVLPYVQSPQSGTVKYNITVAFPAAGLCAGGQCFTLSAAPAGTMLNDACGTYTLTNAGVQGNTGLSGSETVSTCWQH
jgi:type IV pilus assembly protein PilE